MANISEDIYNKIAIEIAADNITGFLFVLNSFGLNIFKPYKHPYWQKQTTLVNEMLFNGAVNILNYCIDRNLLNRQSLEHIENPLGEISNLITHGDIDSIKAIFNIFDININHSNLAIAIPGVLKNQFPQQNTHKSFIRGDLFTFFVLHSIENPDIIPIMDWFMHTHPNEMAEMFKSEPYTIIKCATFCDADLGRVLFKIPKALNYITNNQLLKIQQFAEKNNNSFVISQIEQYLIAKDATEIIKHKNINKNKL